MAATGSRQGAVSPARRSLLLRGGTAALSLAASGLVASCASVGPAVPRSPDPADDAALLDNVLGLEYEAVAAYATALDGAALSDDERAMAQAFQDDHRKHAEALARAIDRLGGQAVTAAAPRDYGFSPGELTDRTDTIQFLLGFEQGLALAHLSGVPAFAAKTLAKNAASLVGIEAMHWASWRSALGEAPVPAPFLG